MQLHVGVSLDEVDDLQKRSEQICVSAVIKALKIVLYLFYFHQIDDDFGRIQYFLFDIHAIHA